MKIFLSYLYYSTGIRLSSFDNPDNISTFPFESLIPISIVFQKTFELSLFGLYSLYL